MIVGDLLTIKGRKPEDDLKLMDDLGLEMHALDTLETGSLSKDWYVNKMRANLEVLTTALNK